MVTDNFHLILKAKFLEEMAPDILHLVNILVLIYISFQTHIKITFKDIMTKNFSALTLPSGLHSSI